ncbi:S8 family serine peptidase [Streptomyces anthocyanicus]|uniref:S8 family serine peptidase n=1 Tax=Streptomyces anthocyanicus TaxID=68174 RepID=UPI003814A9BC
MRRYARLLSGAGLVAVLSLSPAVPAGAAPLRSGPAADGNRGQELPAIPSTLKARADACTPASGKKAEKEDWSRQRLDLEQLHRHSTGAGVTVALIGTGVDPKAAGLSGRVTVRGAAGDDCVGHGTFLAGLIAGTGGDSPYLLGVAPEARVLALRGTDRHGTPAPGRVAEALREATAAGVEVIAVTVALPRRDAELTRAVAEARRAGAVVVAAAAPDPPVARSGETPSRLYWPAGEPGVLSVAGMLPDGTLPEGSLPTAGIDLVAPGAGVVSGGPRGDGHYLGGGAPVAAAYAAGAAATVRAARPGETADAVARRLRATAYPADIPQLDPYAAVTTVLGASGAGGGRRAAVPVTIRETAAADRVVGRATVLVMAGSAAVAGFLWVAYAVPRARARRRLAAGTDAPGRSGGAMPRT